VSFLKFTSQFLLVFGAREDVMSVDVYELNPGLTVAELAYGDAGDNDGNDTSRLVHHIVIMHDSILLSVASHERATSAIPGIQHRTSS
jgi:hypothetical protein